MKSLCIAVLAMFVTVQIASRAGPQSNVERSKGNLEGTWELVSFKHGDQTTFSDVPKGRRQIKLVTATHFAWLAYDVTTATTSSNAGGTYSLQGNSYKEQVEFVSKDVQFLAGKEQPFQIKVEGDTWFVSGFLSNGLKIDERWKRVP